LSYPEGDKMKLPSVLKKEEIELLWAYADEYCSCRFCSFVLRALYYTGCRISEFCFGLRIENIDLEKGEIKLLKCKGDKERIIPILPEFKPILENWIKKSNRDSGYICEHKRNFLTVPLNPRTVERHIKSIGWNVLHKRVYPHLFRASILTHLDRLGFSRKFLKDFAGHISFVTTDRYIRLTIDDLKSEMKQIYYNLAFEQQIESLNRKVYISEKHLISKPKYIG
jgi:integrase